MMFEYFLNPVPHKLRSAEDIMSEASKLSDDAFDAHLADKMGYFGQKDSAEWRNAFALYKAKFKREMAFWVKTELETTRSKSRTVVLENVMLKIDRILDERFMSQAPFLPSLAGGILILCPKFVVALTEMLLHLAPAFMLVSCTIPPANRS
jgi:hypothetical protein